MCMYIKFRIHAYIELPVHIIYTYMSVTYTYIYIFIEYYCGD